MSETHSAREAALGASRQIIRLSANSIRAAHRNEFADASRLIAEARQMVEELKGVRADHPEVFFGGFVEDSLKEYVEASATLAFTQGSPLPTMQELGIGAAAYMNGLAEAIGELRRFVLDILRRDDVSRCENLLEIMDEVYAVLVTLDFPDAVTRGLRRNTDVMRGVIERTRGDLTVALRQRSLEDQLARLADRLDSDAG
ncbi:MAG: haloacid dehalogenase [SAR202 cluster bacterium]|nr:haloacid dehalogenase [Chloroflexota bacterium]MQG59513.1 haloacid dehalogenase [SAR202 cluster bacterium]MQG70074.1 haloacid dehalogenase [SAR202 cluster bacterium]HAL48784.1 haloacid dehalogenase [Dehalococcoidia bacterium]